MSEFQVNWVGIMDASNVQLDADFAKRLEQFVAHERIDHLLSTWSPHQLAELVVSLERELYQSNESKECLNRRLLSTTKLLTDQYAIHRDMRRDARVGNSK